MITVRVDSDFVHHLSFLHRTPYGVQYMSTFAKLWSEWSLKHDGRSHFAGRGRADRVIGARLSALTTFDLGLAPPSKLILSTRGDNDHVIYIIL